ncbi:MAG: hypothetical protein AAGA23_12760 [Pseudomonadota bacterium]
MIRKTLIFALAGVLAVLTSSAAALELSAGDLPENSHWYFHANIGQLRNSELLAPFYAETIGEAESEIQAELGLDLHGELMAVTAYGSSFGPDSATVLLHGLTDATQKLMLDAATEHANVVEFDYAGVSYFQIQGDKEEGRHHGGPDAMLIAFGPDQTLVTSDVEAVRNFVDLGSHLALGESSATGPILVIRADQSLMQGGLRKGGHSSGPFDSSIMENIDQVAMVLSETAAGIVLRAEVQARDAATASYVHNIVQGLVSLKALDAGNDPEVNLLLNQLVIETNDANVNMNVTVPPELARQLVDSL